MFSNRLAQPSILICSKFNPPPFPAALVFHHDVEKKKKERRTAKRYGREGGSISDSICRYKSSGTRNTLTASTTARLREREKRREGGGREEGRRREEKANLFPLTSFTVLRTTRDGRVRVEWRARAPRANTVISPLVPATPVLRSSGVNHPGLWRRRAAGARRGTPRQPPWQPLKINPTPPTPLLPVLLFDAPSSLPILLDVNTAGGVYPSVPYSRFQIYSDRAR